MPARGNGSGRPAAPALSAPAPAAPAPGQARRRLRFAALAVPLLLAASIGAAQDQGPPMSAIDWLSDSVAVPSADGGGGAPQVPAAGLGPDSGGGTGLAGLTPPDPVAVAPLEAPGDGTDAIGILPPAVTGLPAGLWGDGRPEDVARRISAERPEMLPALQALLQTILLAELDPPRGTSETAGDASRATGGATGGDVNTGRGAVFLARVDKLLEMGALEQANALLERAPRDDPQIIRRHFDVALLLGEEQPLCEVLAASPQLSPTYQARIFCLARAGNWESAALLLGTGTVLELISQDDADLFARFLDPELFEGEPPLEMPLNPTPLTFRMYEAIGQAIPTQGLPLAFAHSDLRPNIGWKAQLEAGERLARTGAVSDNQLYGLYSERRAAASGGVWDRVAALREVEGVLRAGDRAGTAEALPALWAALAEARVEVPISHILGPDLAAMDLEGAPGQTAFRMALLSDDYEAQAAGTTPRTGIDRLLVAVARGFVHDSQSDDPRARAVIDGFTAAEPPPRLAALVESNRLGEAILRAITLFTEGASGDLDQVTDALALLRAVGLEDTARRAALEFLILDRQE